jgi:hypothetical protein
MMTYFWLIVAAMLAPLGFMVLCGLFVALCGGAGWLGEQAIGLWFWLKQRGIV